jgi:uncharacterized protein YdeI (YjbR/CyaY-like superfamily)
LRWGDHAKPRSHGATRVGDAIKRWINLTSMKQANMVTNPEVDWYFSKHDRWELAIRKLRAIALDCQLTEALKWGCPCYTMDGHNVVLIHVFKAYCALLFFKGALLKNSDGLLVQQTKNVQAARQIRFTDLSAVVELERAVKACIIEAVAVEKAGLQVPLKKTGEFEMPEELAMQLKEVPGLKQAFSALTPGRQRAYLLHFASAKQSKTREARVAQCMQRILAGKGVDD